jgi:hypothetical protein
MYCPRDLITPFGPAPYRMMFTEPSGVSDEDIVRTMRHTEYEANDDSNS